MLLKILFLAIVLYYVVKTSRALIRAVANDGLRSDLHERRREDVRFNGRNRTTSNGYEDIEDAKYVDI